MHFIAVVDGKAVNRKFSNADDAAAEAQFHVDQWGAICAWVEKVGAADIHTWWKDEQAA